MPFSENMFDYNVPLLSWGVEGDYDVWKLSGVAVKMRQWKWDI